MFKLISDILKSDLEITAYEKLVLMTIAEHDGGNGAFPSIETISSYARCSKKTVERSLKILSEKGLISIQNRSNNGMKTTNLYRINPSKIGCVTESYHGEVSPLKMDASQSRIQKFGCVTESVTDASQSRIEPPSINPKDYKEKNIKKRKSDFPPPSGVTKEAWEGYLETRKNKKAKMTDRAYKLIVNKLMLFSSQGMNINEVLENSTMNNWTGVFPLKKHSSSQTQNMTARQKSDLRFQQEFEKRINGGSSIEPDTTSTIDITNYQPQEKKWN